MEYSFFLCLVLVVTRMKHEPDAILWKSQLPRCPCLAGPMSYQTMKLVAHVERIDLVFGVQIWWSHGWM